MHNKSRNEDRIIIHGHSRHLYNSLIMYNVSACSGTALQRMLALNTILISCCTS